MSFHKNLIQKIKSNQRLDVYNLLDQLLNNHMNLDLEDSFMLKEIKQHHMDLILSFISTEEDPSIICNYLNMIIDFYQKRNWTLNLSSYPLIIRILCSLNRFDEALKYLEMATDINVKNRMISPFFEFNKNLRLLIMLFDKYKYHNVFLEKEYYYLFLNFKTHKLSSSLSYDEEKVKTIIQEIFKIWSDNDFIMKNQLLDLVSFWIKPNLKSKSNFFTLSSNIVIGNQNHNNNNLNVFCNICKTKPIKHILEKVEKEKLTNDLILAHPESKKNLEIFIDWFNKNLKTERETEKEKEKEKETKIKQLNILDGGNIGHFVKGEFSFDVIKKLLNKLSINSDGETINLLIIHQRHFKKYKTEINLEINKDNDNNLVYLTPYQENDDLYWMLASFLSDYEKTFVITNDLLRDHHVNKLDETLFKRWKDNHLTTYSSDITYVSEIKLNYPLEYTIGFQFHETETEVVYHIPVEEGENNIEWYCMKKIKKVLE